MWLDWSKRAHRGLRTWIIAILARQPMNGAEIMDSMDSGSGGWWRPSPGSVYPMLKSLADEGLIKKRESDGRYELTPQGKAESDWPSRIRGTTPRSIEGIISEMSNNISYFEDLAQSKDQKLAESSQQIRELAERLTKLGAKA